MKTFCANNTQFCAHKNRKKRFIGLLIAGAMGLSGTALCITNIIQLAHLGNKVDALHTALGTITSSIVGMGKSVQKLTLAHEELYRFIHHSMQDIVATIEQVHCDNKSFTSQVKGELIKHLFAERAKDTVEGIIQGVLHGAISLEVINIAMLSKIFQLSTVLRESLLSKEPSLVYQFGRLYPITINFSTFRFAMILEIPVVYEHNLHPYFKVRNLHPWHDQKADLKMKFPLPLHTVREAGTSFQAIDLSIKLSIRRYAQELQKSIIAQKLDSETDIVSTPAGILFRTTEPTITISKEVVASTLVKGNKLAVPANGVKWISYSNFTHLIVANKILNSVMNTVQLSITSTSYFEFYDPPNLEINPPVWTNLETAEASNLEARHIAEEQIKKYSA